MCGSRKYPNLPQEGFSEIPKQMGSKFLKVSMNSDWNFWRDRFGEGGSNKKKSLFGRVMDIFFWKISILNNQPYSDWVFP